MHQRVILCHPRTEKKTTTESNVAVFYSIMLYIFQIHQDPVIITLTCR